MTAKSGKPTGSEGVPGLDQDDWLRAVAESTAKACQAPVELLGEYLTMLADAAVSGRRPRPEQLAAVRDLGRSAAEQGVGAGQAVELYLGAAWRLWRQLPMVVRSRDRERVREAAEAVLRVLDDAIGVFLDSHQAARREMIRHEESLRREFIDDLLRGDADVSRLVERAEPFGLDLGQSHQVALAAPSDPQDKLDRTTTAIDRVTTVIDRAATVLERAVVEQFGDREVLVATKDGNVVVLVPGPSRSSRARSIEVTEVIQKELSRLTSGQPWHTSAGRPYVGAYGIARSYEEAREALALGERLGMDAGTVQPRDLLVYRVLARDQAATLDLVRDLLAPLAGARGGPGLLLETLRCYFSCGAVATETARRMNVSVRTITYRLARVKALTGQDPSDPATRFALQVAVEAARLFDWPARDLPTGP
ncbi:MAG TPA: helix-turn-helix domain-containing protein [Jatrophihabitans sp.]|jgi:sugar diacid utilization regulator|uniref:PucR family transcriptional regulator n=1 Tax=Jatrophihabitans sp. TaxID=1932789 RepID=UPI002EEE0AF0